MATTKFATLASVLLLAGCGMRPMVGTLTRLSTPPVDDSLAVIANIEGQPPLVIGDVVYLASCPCLVGPCKRTYGGTSEQRAIGGIAEKRSIGGVSEQRIGGGAAETRVTAGQGEQRIASGQAESRARGGAQEARVSGAAGEQRTTIGAGENRDTRGATEGLTCSIHPGSHVFQVKTAGSLALRYFDGKSIRAAVDGRVPF